MQQLYSDKEIRQQQAEILDSLNTTVEEVKAATTYVNSMWNRLWYGDLETAYKCTPLYILSLIDCFAHETIWNVNRAVWWINKFSNEKNCWLPWDGIGLGGRWINEHTSIHAYSQIAKGFPNNNVRVSETCNSQNVLAFEVLEHVQDPIAMVESWGHEPKMLCHRSPFKVNSHGHWNWYRFSGQQFAPERAGARFSYELRQRGWKLGHTFLDYDRHINGVPTFFVRT